MTKSAGDEAEAAHRGAEEDERRHDQDDARQGTAPIGSPSPATNPLATMSDAEQDEHAAEHQREVARPHAQRRAEIVGERRQRRRPARSRRRSTPARMSFSAYGRSPASASPRRCEEPMGRRRRRPIGSWSRYAAVTPAASMSGFQSAICASSSSRAPRASPGPRATGAVPSSASCVDDGLVGERDLAAPP